MPTTAPTTMNVGIVEPDEVSLSSFVATAVAASDALTPPSVSKLELVYSFCSR